MIELSPLTAGRQPEAGNVPPIKPFAEPMAFEAEEALLGDKVERPAICSAKSTLFCVVLVGSVWICQLLHAWRLLTGIASFLSLVVCLLMAMVFSVTVQRNVLYGHNFRKCWEDPTKLDNWNLQHHTRNVQIEVSGRRLCAWHLVPAHLASELQFASEKEKDRRFDELLGDLKTPAVLFCHGQAGTRATPGRRETCRRLANDLGAHVLIFDYRSFGDSTPLPPNPEGLIEDSMAAVRWMEARGRNPEEFLIYGQSLGSAVAIQLARRLEEAGGSLKGLVCDVPFRNAFAALDFHPAALPLRLLPGLMWMLSYFALDKWDNEAVVPELRCPLLFIAAAHDRMVGPKGAEALYNATEKVPGRHSYLLLEESGHGNTYTFKQWRASVETML